MGKHIDKRILQHYRSIGHLSASRKVLQRYLSKYDTEGSSTPRLHSLDDSSRGHITSSSSFLFGESGRVGQQANSLRYPVSSLKSPIRNSITLGSLTSDPLNYHRVDLEVPRGVSASPLDKGVDLEELEGADSDLFLMMQKKKGSDRKTESFLESEEL